MELGQKVGRAFPFLGRSRLMSPERSELTPMRSDDARRQRTQELFEEIESCEDDDVRHRLRDDVIVCNIPVADRLAARFAGRGVPADDLRQVARTCLVRVVRDYRLDRAKDFLSYAVPSIRGELRKHFRDAGWTVRPPRRLQEARLAVSDARADLSQDLGREPTPEELAERTGFDVETVREASSIEHCFRPSSLDQPLRGDDDSRTTGDGVGAEDDEFDRSEARVMLEPLLKELEPRDRKVIELRYFRGLTQSEVGDRIGVSQMQVSRIQSRVLRQLRDAAKAG